MKLCRMDVEICPGCRTGSHLDMESHFESLGSIRNRIRVFCTRCGREVVAHQPDNAIALWNWAAIRDVETAYHPCGREFRELKARSAAFREESYQLEARCLDLVTEMVLSKCPLRSGDFIKVPRWSGDLFHVHEVGADYSPDVGGFVVVRARRYSSTGQPLSWESLSREKLAGFESVEPYVRVTRWQALKPGDCCRLARDEAIEVFTVDESLGKAVVISSRAGEKKILRTLRGLERLLPRAPA